MAPSITDEHEGALAKKDDALAGAAVSAAVGLAVYGLRRLAASRDEHPSRGVSLPAGWGAGPETLLPLAEHAAVAAGRWVAKNSPAVVRERLLPRFIESFQDAA